MVAGQLGWIDGTGFDWCSRDEEMDDDPAVAGSNTCCHIHDAHHKCHAGPFLARVPDGCCLGVCPSREGLHLHSSCV